MLVTYMETVIAGPNFFIVGVNYPKNNTADDYIPHYHTFLFSLVSLLIIIFVLCFFIL